VRFVRASVVLEAYTVIFQECRAIHNRLRRHGTTTIWLHRHSFNRDFGAWLHCKPNHSSILSVALPSKIANLKSQIEGTPWCNGNTAPFGGVILGSNPSGVAT